MSTTQHRAMSLQRTRVMRVQAQQERFNQTHVRALLYINSRLVVVIAQEQLLSPPAGPCSPSIAARRWARRGDGRLVPWWLWFLPPPRV
jgi:hypothetical protein